MTWAIELRRLLPRRPAVAPAVGDPIADLATCRRRPKPRAGGPACTHCKIQRAVMEAYQESVMREELTKAVDLALAGDWAAAHAICQRHEDDRTACWLHAVLHKIEPDEANARYWYREAGQHYESYADPKAELTAIKAVLTY